MKRMGLVFYLLHALPFFTRADLHLEKVERTGMTAGYVKCIRQDKKGFIWFGSQEGLFRYDGYEFRAFLNFPGDAQTLSNNNIEFLYPEESGMLWVGSRGGLSCIDTRTLRIRNYITAAPMSVYAIVPRDDTSFFVGTNRGLFEFYKPSGRWRPVPAIDQSVFIRDLTSGANGDLYVTTHNGLYIYNRNSAAVRHLDLPILAGNTSRLPIAHRSMLDAKGDLWITTWNDGLVRYEAATGRWSACLAETHGKPDTAWVSNYDLQEDGQGKIWTANSENGITLIDPLHHSSTSYPLFWDPEKHIPDRVYSLFRDRSGIWWVGTESGIYKSDPHKASLSRIDFSGPDNTPLVRSDLTPLCMLKDREGCWWMGTYEGLFLFDETTGTMRDYSAAAGITTRVGVYTILEDEQGNIWASARGRLIHLAVKRFADGRLPQISPHSSPLLNSVITALFRDHLGRYWIGTHRDGVYRWDPANWRFIAIPNNDTSGTAGLANKNEIRSFLELRDGTIILGGERTGMIRLDPSDGHFENVKAFNRAADGDYISINTIARDDLGKIWVGSGEGNGLLETDEHFTDIRRFTTKDGLPSMNIPALLTAPNDHVWLITEGALVDYRPLHKKMTVFGKEAGIRNPYSMLSICLLDNGAVAAGDMGCVQIYEGGTPAKSSSPPPVEITEFKVFDNSYPIADRNRPELAFDQNYFTFAFTALSYTHPLQNRYAYMLEGVDKKWNDAGGRRYVSYANLKEGSYTFKVKACNNQGVWNETPATLSFVIRPPFWRTWWFSLLIAAGLVSLAYIAWSTDRQHRLSKEQLRNKIARDLHDDIGSTLSGINIFSRIALQKLEADPSASSELLQRISQRSGKTMEALSDIVWSINTREDNMGNLLARMHEYLGEVADPLGIRYEFSIDHAVNNAHIDMDIRRDIYLIFKEAIHNASKYAGAGLIRILLKKEKGRMASGKGEKGRMATMLIEDDGKGFDIQSVAGGNGITNMRERAAKIGARFDMESRPGKGTRISLVFPVT